MGFLCFIKKKRLVPDQIRRYPQKPKDAFHWKTKPFFFKTSACKFADIWHLTAAELLTMPDSHTAPYKLTGTVLLSENGLGRFFVAPSHSSTNSVLLPCQRSQSSCHLFTEIVLVHIFAPCQYCLVCQSTKHLLAKRDHTQLVSISALLCYFKFCTTVSYYLHSAVTHCESKRTVTRNFSCTSTHCESKSASFSLLFESFDHRQWLLLRHSLSLPPGHFPCQPRSLRSWRAVARCFELSHLTVRLEAP